MNDLQLDPVRSTLEELKANPQRFQRRGGYERLLALIEEGHPPDALEDLLGEESSFAGDLLWTVCELEDVERYVAKAAIHLSASDPGTAAYAFEVLLRGARDGACLEMGLNLLRSVPVPVREHAALVLASQGLVRAKEVFRLADWNWAADLVDEFADGSRTVEATVDALVNDPRGDRQLVGLVLATVSSEQNEGALRVLEQSEAEWLRNFAERLRRMFQRRWAPTGQQQ
jgi:hypothetical protein